MYKGLTYNDGGSGGSTSHAAKKITHQTNERQYDQYNGAVD